MKLTIHLHVVSRITKRAAVFPLFCMLPWGAQEQLYLHSITTDITMGLEETTRVRLFRTVTSCGLW
jgi:hypothetical protein